MSFLVISSSLNPESRSYLLARKAHDLLSESQSADWLDLRKVKLPQCDGDRSFQSAPVVEVRARIESATCILLAVPIYNFDCGSAAKNLIELTGRAWSDKTVGFLCAAGGKSSYMSIMSLANSLMLDFRSLIIPRFVYASGDAFDGDRIIDASIVERIEELVDAAVRLNGVSIPAAERKS